MHGQTTNGPQATDTSDHSRALNPAGQHERSSWQANSRTTDGQGS